MAIALGMGSGGVWRQWVCRMRRADAEVGIGRWKLSLWTGRLADWGSSERAGQRSACDCLLLHYSRAAVRSEGDGYLDQHMRVPYNCLVAAADKRLAISRRVDEPLRPPSADRHRHCKLSVHPASAQAERGPMPESLIVGSSTPCRRHSPVTWSAADTDHQCQCARASVPCA